MAKNKGEFSRAAENLIAAFRQVPEDRGRSRRRPTTDIAPLIDELLVKYRISHESLEHSIREQWPAIVGVANAAYSHPVVVERGQLVVRVAHSVVRNELFLHRAAILARLRQLPGCSTIRSLQLRAS